MTPLFNAIRPAFAGDPATRDDDFLWLEEVNGRRALEWVHAENTRTSAAFTQGHDFSRLNQQLLDLLNKDSRLPQVAQYGEYYYNFWQDKHNPRGLLRRTSPAEYVKDVPAWETVLDIDALCAREDKNWVYQGFTALEPDYRLCLVALSPGGGDAAEYREFDLAAKQFVKSGFYVPVAKSNVSWVDKDTLFVATDAGPGSMTHSGYPRIARRWKRNTPFDTAQVVYQVAEDDMTVAAYRDSGGGFTRDFVGRIKDFFHTEYFLLAQYDKKIKIDIPDDARFSTFREWLIIRLNSSWVVEGKHYVAGSLLAANFDDYIAGKKTLHPLFIPGESTVLQRYTRTRDSLIASVMNNVASELVILTPKAGRWTRESLVKPDNFSTLMVGSTSDENNGYLLTSNSYLQPASLYRGELFTGEPTLIKQAPADFDADKYAVSQHFAVSKDGTRIPYFQIARKDLPLNGKNPTLLYGYGGFGISLTPQYLGGKGISWLDRGGVYVVANIRGGGEFGPDWHQSAIQQHKLRSYEDFASVAQDLIARRVTAPAHLGVEGGSNGGLLVGNMLTLYPQLFGCVVCEVPLLDMQRYTRLSAGASWIAEYGDPDKPDQWQYVKTFSPYHNLHSGVTYPPVLFYTATSDDRVNPAHARKMAARMQSLGIENVYFYENTDGGHSASADKKQSAFHSALVSEFLWRNLG
ncbi:S9 family peptidase [Pluralibacter gergoviae]